MTISADEEIVPEEDCSSSKGTKPKNRTEHLPMGRKPLSRRRKSSSTDGKEYSNESGFLNTKAKPSVYHAVVVIFLEFFAWGLLTTPVIEVLRNTFGKHTFLINGLVQGIKGLLSFLSAPLLGALSDVWGRRMFLLLTVVCTCAPIPLMSISPWWFFALLSISGTFAVTFSIVFAYVADITDEEERSSAYGLVSATFAASLVTSPVIGTYISKLYGINVVVALSSSIALLDVVFILIAVPESLAERVRSSATGWGQPISWDRVDPFSSLRTALSDPTNMLLCLCVFLSYLPEAGQYSCFFIYLTQVIGFSVEKVASFIAVIGVLSIIAQTALLTTLIQTTSKSTTILVALVFQAIQLFFYAFSRTEFMMWTAGALAAVSSISYPAFSTLISTNADVDQQGLVQGMVTGVRGLCNGLGPAVYGVIFYIFNVKVDEGVMDLTGATEAVEGEEPAPQLDPAPELDPPLVDSSILPGPPFLFGACSVVLALMIAALLPRRLKNKTRERKIKLEAESGEPIETNNLLQKAST